MFFATEHGCLQLTIRYLGSQFKVAWVDDYSSATCAGWPIGCTAFPSGFNGSPKGSDQESKCDLYRVLELHRHGRGYGARIMESLVQSTTNLQSFTNMLDCRLPYGHSNSIKLRPAISIASISGTG